jgi:UDP-N-acetylglucosamine 2-epimerase
MRVLSVVGNRPQFIKSAPLSVALREAGIDEVVLHTGQHWDAGMSQVFFDELAIPEPAHRLDLRTADPAAMTPPIRAVVEAERPDWVLVFGDTNSRRGCGASTSRCPRSGTGSRSTRSQPFSSARTSARRRNSNPSACTAAVRWSAT